MLGHRREVRFNGAGALTTVYDMAAASVTVTAEILNQLTVHEIQTVLKAAEISISRDCRGSKVQLVEHVLKSAPSHMLDELQQRARAQRQRSRLLEEEGKELNSGPSIDESTMLKQVWRC